jgi:hypothetical protein
MNQTPAASTTTTRLVVVNAHSRTLADIEHLAHQVDEAFSTRLDEASYFLSTHTIAEPDRHLAAVLSWTGGPDHGEMTRALAAAVNDADASGEDDLVTVVGGHAALAPGLAAAVAEHTTRTTGRLARYPGRTAIERRLTASEIVTLSCVDEVTGLAGTDVQPDSMVDLTGFARPQWRSGRCVLLVQPGATTLIPFEARQQIPCCADH